MRTLATGLLAALATAASLAAADYDDADLDARIAKLRQVDIAVPLPAGATGPIRYELQRHAFPFGTCVQAQAMDARWAGKTPISDDDRARYAEIASTHFTAAVAGNEHKWYGMEKAEGPHDQCARFVMDWCAARELPMRGHCVWWGVPKYTPQWMQDLPAEQLEARMKARLDQVLRVFRGRIQEWDLMNELTDHDLFSEKAKAAGIAGWDAPAQYFRWAVEAAPDFTWFINEFGPLQYGKEEHIAKVEKLARGLQEAGVRFDGIGDQAHFFRQVPPAAELWRILDRLGAFGVPVLITEFDLAFRGMTPAQQAEGLRRFVKTCYAHPAVHGIYLWGFWEGLMWRKEAALWKKDWTLTPAAEAWIALLQREWTSAGEATAAEGQLRFRGYPGRYRLSWAGGETTAQVALPARTVMP
jgi:endo-1,4-beta-xylanase